MPHDFFRFKKFIIEQDRCAMKVGTDSVLLGAWAEVGDAQKVLDIGTGTGILALMMAQKSKAKITAIEIDEGAALQAQENVQNSPWSDRVRVFPTSLQNFNSDILFDVIITNPPFFVSSLKNPDEQRTIARHSDSLPFESLLDGVNRFLTADGIFYLVLPKSQSAFFENMANDKGFYLRKILRVKARQKDELEIRHLLAFSRTQQVVADSLLSIEKEYRHEYTEEYKKLTKDFYLKF